ncbi:VWA domain-containing protein [Paenibacillus aurantius]|uniref:VWA domain-containing protein n=1 Tax=Paenibacillus aurantius TaxID=2918900 RepID=A0AA96RDH4_9BACL|nr:VWA domain-containing protein [Paenibacillus aurantius]WNQ09837.1 VWA domain-containing protein [Paenibacillus aurantius]
MHFQWLNGLWFGLTLPAIVLLYLLKRQYIDTEIPSHLLWNRVLRNLEANRPWQKLRNQLLLILQLAAAALLVFALLQPFSWSPKGESGHTVYVLDRSASMEAGTGSGEGTNSALEEAKRRIAERIQAKSPGSLVTLLLMGTEPEVPVAREASADRVLEALKAVTPSYGKTAYKETMSLAAALTQDDPDGEIRVYTDGRWTDPAAGLTYSVPVHREDVGNPDAGNVSVMQFGVKAPDSSSGTMSAVAVLRNWGGTAREVEVTLAAGSQAGPSRQVTIPAGNQRSLYWDGLPLSDYYRIQAVDPEDTYPADNRAYAFPEGDRPRKALLLSEGNLFLEKALRLANIEITKMAVQPGTAPLTAESKPDLIVVDSVSPSLLQTKEWKALLDSLPVWYIHSGVEGEDEEGGRDYRITEHPVTRYISFQDTHIAKRTKVGSVPWGKPVISDGTSPLILAGEENGRPRLLFTFDLHQSDLPLRSEFPILVQNAVDWLGSAQGASLGRVTAGSRKELAVSPQTVSAEWVAVDSPGSSPVSLPAEKKDKAVSGSQTVPDRPGLYQFVEKAEKGQGEIRRYLEAAADPGESDFARRPELVFPGAQEGTGEEGVSSEEPADRHAGESPYSWLPWVLLLAAVVILAEWGVFRRGNSI